MKTPKDEGWMDLSDQLQEEELKRRWVLKRKKSKKRKTK